MNQKNLEYLKDSLKYLGFGEKLNKNLEEQINQQPANFQLSTAGEFKKGDIEDKVGYVIDFKKSEQNDMYFLNRYQATLKHDDPKQEKSQTFYITKSSGITAKEAYNLLSGRSVFKKLENKAGEEYKAWVRLDFQEPKDKNNNFKVRPFNENYGFELEKVLANYPIKELNDAERKASMIKSLEKGNTTAVTFVKNGAEEKMHLEANPQYKNLIVYDAAMKKIFQEREKKETKQDPDKSKEKKETVAASDDDDSARKGKKKGKGVGV